MSSILSIIRMIGLLISVFGYMLYIISKTKIKIEFIPVIVFSGIISVLYIAGLLNILYYTTYAIFITGLFLFIYSGIKNRFRSLLNKNQITIGTIFLLITVCYYIIMLRGAKFISHDNFSHWGLVVKEMLLFNRMPNSQSSLIIFNTYPLGSSLFIYYVCRIIGVAESKMMIAQMFLVMSCIYAIFGVLSKKSIAVSVIALCSAFYMIIGYLGFDCLLVDTLLPLIGLVGTIIIINYRNDTKKACVFSLPVLISTLLIKNSGIAFTLINIVLLFFIAVRLRKYQPKTLIYVVSTMIICIFASILWKQHTDYVFPNIISKHSLNLAYFKEIYLEKTSQIKAEVTAKFIHTLLNLSTPSTKAMLIINIGAVTLIILEKVLYKINGKWIMGGLISADVIFIIYQIGNLGMYMFSMPNYEASILASYNRYSYSIVIYIIGIVTICLIQDFEIILNKIAITTISKNRIKIAVCFISMMGLVLSSGNALIDSNYSRIYQLSEYQNSIPERLERYIGENWAGYSSSKYLIYAPKSEYYVSNGYLFYIARYKSYSHNITVISKFDSGAVLDTIMNYDYFIIFDDDPDMSSFMSRYLDKTSYIGRYSVKDTFK